MKKKVLLNTLLKSFFIGCIVILMSCKKKELPVPKPDIGDAVSASLSMSSNYKYQIYFDLSSGLEKGRNLKSIWDIGISITDSMQHIILNTSKLMAIMPINTSEFYTKIDTLGFEQNKRIDEPSGQINLLATNGLTAFIISKGFNENGTFLGFFKMKVIVNSATTFAATICNLNNSDEQNYSLTKSGDFNYIFLNWANGMQETAVEPEKLIWDLVFTQYSHLFYEPELTPYLVTGALTNKFGVMSKLIENVAFEAVDLNVAETQILSSDRNVIGYNWKSFNGSSFVTHPEKIYLIKDVEGIFYKLRFTDFYNDLGEKGNPKFEYQRL
jgi:hypothetical protein